MPQISHKSATLPSSPMRKLTPFAEQAQARGTKVYRLNIGQPDIDSPVEAIRAVQGINDSYFAYTHSAGMESCRRKMAKYYRNAGIDLSWEEILVTTGGSEALLMAMQVATDAGDEILLTEPLYANYNSIAHQFDIHPVAVTSTIENDFALPPIEDFEKAITERTRAILICNPNNPTGYLYSREELMQLRDIVLRHDLFLICDEVYREFCYDGAKHYSVMNIEGLEQHTILIDSASKRYSMCGARLGAFATHNTDALAAALRMGQARLSPPYLAQVAAQGAMDAPADYFRRVNQEYTLRRDFLVDALNRIPGVYCPKPRGAFYAVVRLPVDNAERFAQWMLEEFQYKGQTVMLAPASGFYATPNKGQNEVRVAYVLKKEDLAAAVECLEQALAIYPGRTL